MCTDCATFKKFAAAKAGAIRPPAAIAAACIEEGPMIGLGWGDCFLRVLFEAFADFGGARCTGACCSGGSGDLTGTFTGKGMGTGTGTGSTSAGEGAAADLTSGILGANTADLC